MVVIKPNVWTEPDERGRRKPDHMVLPMRVAAPLAILAREAVDQVMGGVSHNDAQQVLLDIIGSSSPIQAESAVSLLGTFLPVSLGTLTQLAFNKDIFRNANIDSATRNERATPAAQFVGVHTPLSPGQA